MMETWKNRAYEIEPKLDQIIANVRMFDESRKSFKARINELQKAYDKAYKLCLVGIILDLVRELQQQKQNYKNANGKYHICKALLSDVVCQAKFETSFEG